MRIMSTGKRTHRPKRHTLLTLLFTFSIVAPPPNQHLCLRTRTPWPPERNPCPIRSNASLQRVYSVYLCKNQMK